MQFEHLDQFVLNHFFWKNKENSYVMHVVKFLSMGILINLSSRQIADYTFRL